MNYTVKSFIAVIVLVGVVVAVGLLIGKGGITGGAVADSIACYDNDDCDDKIPNTIDTCKNPGTEYALCVSKPRE